MADEPTDAQRKVKALLDDARTKIQPHLDALVAHTTEAARQPAADMGEAPTAENRRAAEFSHVPSLYAPAVGAVVTDIRRAADKGWAELPQPWADCFCHVVACICERVGARSGVEVAP